jgi:hypothetical protein
MIGTVFFCTRDVVNEVTTDTSVVTPCVRTVLDCFQRFRATYRLHLRGRGIAFLRYVGRYQQHGTTLRSTICAVITSNLVSHKEIFFWQPSA